MGNKWLIFVLTVIANTAMACVDFHAFPDGSAGHTVARIAGFVLFNSLALLGSPVTRTPAAPAPVLPPGSSER